MNLFLAKVIIVILILIPLHSFGQVSVPGDYFNKIDKRDSSSLTLYESVKPNTQESFKFLDPFIKLAFNSAYPRGYNDGPVWKGKGTTLELHAGISGNKGAFSYTLSPTFFISQNANFDLPDQTNNLSPFSYQFEVEDRGIDWVQRYGDDSFATFHLGQSELRFQKGKFVSSLSTQNYSVGPSIYNPIIISRQGGGFPHLRIGSEPFDLKIRKLDFGKVEVNLLVGLLAESDYFDTNKKNDDRYFNGLFIGYTPKFLPELTISLNKVLYKDTQFFEIKDVISTINILDDGVREGINTNDTFDQLASISMNWNFPTTGFRVYAEFAKNDFTSAGPIRWLLIEPEHSRAYSIGFGKTGDLKKGTFTINYEHTNLSRNLTYLWRPSPTFYAHGINKQGYTQNGQIIGAGIGPGGNSDHLGISLNYSENIYGLLIQRIEKNKDYFAVSVQNPNLHDAEYSAGLYFQKEAAKLTLSLQSTFSYNYNRDYFGSSVFNFYFGIGTRIKLQ